MTEEHVLDLIPAYVLGALDVEEAQQAAEHLEHCLKCQEELKAYQMVVTELALASPQRAPSPRLKEQVMKQIQSPAPQNTPGWFQQFKKNLAHYSPILNLASLVIILVLATSNLLLRQQARHPQPPLHSIALASTDAAPVATGVIVVSTDGEHGTLVVDGLPDLGETQQYQLWLIEDGKRTSGGIFSVSSEGYGSLWVDSPKPLSAYQAFGVTIEPFGGSPSPTGDKVLGGQS